MSKVAQQEEKKAWFGKSRRTENEYKYNKVVWKRSKSGSVEVGFPRMMMII